MIYFNNYIFHYIPIYCDITSRQITINYFKLQCFDFNISINIVKILLYLNYLNPEIFIFQVNQDIQVKINKDKII